MALADGYLELSIKNHKNPLIMRIHEGRLDDNKWHLVKVNKSGKELRLQVEYFLSNIGFPLMIEYFQIYAFNFLGRRLPYDQ